MQILQQIQRLRVPSILQSLHTIHAFSMLLLQLFLLFSALIGNVAGLLPQGHELIYGQRYNRHDEPVWEVQSSSPSRPSSPNTDAIGLTAWEIRQAQRTAPNARTARSAARSPSPDVGSSPHNFATPVPTPTPSPSPSPPRSSQRGKKGSGIGKLFGCFACGKPSTSGSPRGSGRRRYGSPGASTRNSPSRQGSRRSSGGGSSAHGSRGASPEQQYYHEGSSGMWRPWGE